jgi:ATP-dependent DNA helicase RecG
LLLTKYLKAAVSYEGIVRVERFPVPREALCEAVLNALVHRDYMIPAPVQIRVYDDRLVLWNPAVLPEGWTAATLLTPHTSHPYNPEIANAFFCAGEIEAWGRGIERIFDACRAAATPLPQLRFEAGGIWTEFAFNETYLRLMRGDESQTTDPVTTPVGEFVRLLAQCEPLDNEAIREAFGLKNRRRLRETYIRPSLAMGLIVPTLPDKPNRRLQKYRLTARGAAMLASMKQGNAAS